MTLMRPVRFVVFPDQPHVLLVCVGDDEIGEVPLPAHISVPYTLAGVRAACRDAGVEARVTENVLGRWWKPAVMALFADRAERRQRDRAAEAARATAQQHSNNPIFQERGRLVLRKQAVDAAIRALKQRLNDARAAAAIRQEFLPEDTYRDLNHRLAAAQTESQGLQSRLTDLRAAERVARKARHEARQLSAQAFNWPARFVTLVKEFLEPDLFEALAAAVNEEQTAATKAGDAQPEDD